MNERILVVDDEPDVLGMLQSFLTAEGYEPLTASCAREMLPLIRSARPTLVLLDVGLPDGNGLDLMTQQLLPELGDNRVIIMTGHGDAGDGERAVQLGAYDFVTKPLDLSRLRITIRNCVRLYELQQEFTNLTERAEPRVSLAHLVGGSPQMLEVIERIKQVAPYDAPVLILGESGTGKELVARAIHALSPRSKGPFVPIDCGALPETLVEAELFGHERGAFSGAVRAKPGKLEQATGGTVLFDEIGNVPLLIQPKLLRVLQTQVVEPLGAQQARPVDVRVLSATNADLDPMVAEGNFRRDLYHRLNTVVITVPPLRQRTGDIPLLAHYALMQAARAYKKSVRGISPDAIALLETYPWPGNVRELENCLRSAVILADRVVAPEHLPLQIREKCCQVKRCPAVAIKAGESLSQIRRRAADEAEQAAILRVLEETGWNKAETARRLRVDYKTLYLKIRYHSLSRPEH